jgi:hypothetical protein
MSGKRVTLHSEITITNVPRARRALVEWIRAHYDSNFSFTEDELDDADFEDLCSDLNINAIQSGGETTISFTNFNWSMTLKETFNVLMPFMADNSTLQIDWSDGNKTIWKVMGKKKKEMVGYTVWIEPKKGLACPDCGYVFGLGKKRGH